MEEQPVERVRVPRQNEILGIVESMLGANKILVFCQDNKKRIIRIPGRLRKKIWIRERDVILVKPWDIQSDERGDVVWIYKQNQIEWLRKRGILKIKI